MAKVKFGNLLKTAASFIPGAGPYVAAADALFGGGGGGGGSMQPAQQAFAAMMPFLDTLKGRIPQHEQLLQQLLEAARGIQSLASGVDENALLDQYMKTAQRELLPRLVDSAISGPLASAVQRGVGMSGSLAGNIVSRASQDAAFNLLAEDMKRRLEVPDRQIARNMNALNALAAIAGMADPFSAAGSLLPMFAQAGIGLSNLRAGQQERQAQGLQGLMSGLNPGKDFQTFTDWFNRRVLSRGGSRPTIDLLARPVGRV